MVILKADGKEQNKKAKTITTDIIDIISIKADLIRLANLW